jgi:hypothetical protein
MLANPPAKVIPDELRVELVVIIKLVEPDGAALLTYTGPDMIAPFVKVKFIALPEQVKSPTLVQNVIVYGLPVIVLEAMAKVGTICGVTVTPPVPMS